MSSLRWTDSTHLYGYFRCTSRVMHILYTGCLLTFVFEIPKVLTLRRKVRNSPERLWFDKALRALYLTGTAHTLHSMTRVNFPRVNSCKLSRRLSEVQCDQECSLYYQISPTTVTISHGNFKITCGLYQGVRGGGLKPDFRSCQKLLSDILTKEIWHQNYYYRYRVTDFH